MAADTRRLAVIGLGHVGLPLAQEATRAGWSTIGFDSSASVIAGLRSGASHVDDVSDEDVERMSTTGFEVSTDHRRLREADVVVICVPTPLSDEGGPDLTAVCAAAASVAHQLRVGQLVVLESTTYPGTTEEVLVPILEGSGLRAGVDFAVAFSPERIDPGNERYTLRNTPKIVGGLTPKCTEHAVTFYESVVDTVIAAKGLREAEMAKLLENTYRHINIALVNEMARFCHELDIDLWDAIRCASTKPFGFQAFFPGPGVGGHCIPIDPNYLSHRVRTHLGQPFRFVELAQEINESMPAYVARRAQDLLNEAGLAVRGARITLLGVTYKANISDQRGSPAVQIALSLLNLGADLRYHDPYVGTWRVGDIDVARVVDLEAALADSDLTILLQAHRDYDAERLSGGHVPILDTRGVLHGPAVSAL